MKKAISEMTSPPSKKPTMKSSSKSYFDPVLVKKRKERDDLEKVEVVLTAKAPLVEAVEKANKKKTLDPKAAKVSHAAKVPKSTKKGLIFIKDAEKKSPTSSSTRQF